MRQNPAIHLKASQLRESVERLSWSSPGIKAKGKSQWLDLLEMTAPEYDLFLKGNLGLPVHALEAICNRFLITEQQLEKGEIDFREIAINQSPANLDFPERYRIAAFGRRRTTIHALDFVEKNSGWRMRAKLLQDHDIGERLLTEPMGAISIQCITDICSTLRTAYAYRDRDFYRMGLYAGISRQNPALCELLENCTNPGEIYERLFTDLMRFFEHNCHYDVVRLDDRRCTVEVRDRSSIASAIGVRNLGSADVCSLKAGWMAAAPSYLGLPFAKIEEVSCVHRGDPVCCFEIDFEEASAVS